MKIVVFLGPSLDLATARRHLDAIYLPPAGQADLISAVLQHEPHIVALIDGVFGQSLAVWHKEILFALDQGIAVYGAASMGALRAIETEAFGMIGFGEVVRMYKTGEIEDDDEVALAHAGPEDGHRPLSEPMVNLRRTFAAVEAAGIIDRATRDRLIAAAKELYFPDRLYRDIFAAAGLAPPLRAAIEAFVRTGAVDVKREDAIGLLDHLRLLDAPPPVAPFTLARSHFLEVLRQRDRIVQREAGPVDLASIAFHAALHRADFADLNALALDHALAQIMAEQIGLAVDAEEVAAEAARFQYRLGLNLEDEAARADWLKNNDLNEAAFGRLMTEAALHRKLHHWLIGRRYMERTTQPVLDMLRLRGLYPEIAEEAAFFQRVEAIHRGDFAEVAALGIDRLVRDHVLETGMPIDTHHSIWGLEAGFADSNDLRLELARSRLVRRVVAEVAGEAAAAVSAPLVETDVVETDRTGESDG